MTAAAIGTSGHIAMNGSLRPRTSMLLDGLRIVAALVVFASHCAQHWNQAASAWIGPWAHAAVVVFFVVSGYVIAFSTLSGRAVTLSGYAAARVSRLWSVVVPALVLTAALQGLGTALAPDVYANASRGHDALRYLLSLCFVQSTWWLSAAPPTNGPLWSLSYEFWYYAMFGGAVLARTARQRAMVLLLAMVIAGPAILLLAPAWLAGVGAFMWRRRYRRATRWQGPMALLGGMALAALALGPLTDLPWALGRPPWFFSASFISDALLAVGVALLIAACDAGLPPPGVPFGSAFSPQPDAMRPVESGVTGRWVAWLRKLGDYTFPLYLLHFPLIFFFTAVTGFRAQGLQDGLTAALPMLALTLLLGHATERWRPWWRRQAFSCIGPHR